MAIRTRSLTPPQSVALTARAISTAMMIEAIAAIVLAVMIALTATATDWGEVGQRVATSTDALARLLFNEYILPFEVVSVLLLAAVIGGVYLAKREDRDA